MGHTTQALVFLIFLWSLERGVRSQRGHCAGDQCFAVFQESLDFADAQRRCKDLLGHLMTVKTLQAQEVLLNLLGGLSGRYWIGLQLPDGRCPAASAPQPQLFGYRWITGDDATAADFHNWGRFDSRCPPDFKCVSVSVNSTWWQQSCPDILTGFVCQYELEEPCSRLGEHVEYEIPMGFNGSDLAWFPQGSIAVTKQLEAEYLESKHICFAGDWKPAPWQCEVMNGGCEHGCVTLNQQHSCTCPSGQALHVNSVTCADDPCADCAHGQCQPEGDSFVCRCNQGYTQVPWNRKACVDVNECNDEDSCTEESQECVNTAGGFKCICRDGFFEEDGACVDVSICDKCEHMSCDKSDGVYKCTCRRGYRVSDSDPTKCEVHCTQQECPADCIQNSDRPGLNLCYCADGYIQDTRNDTVVCTDIDECEDDIDECDHDCINAYGGYRCLCEEGFELLGDHKCVSAEVGSGSTPTYQDSAPVAVHPNPTAVPAYVKAGSLLGIAVFVAVCMVLLYCLVRNALRRCGKLDLTLSPEVDIFYLQQVTTEKYKRFSFDKQWKNDSQRL